MTERNKELAYAVADAIENGAIEGLGFNMQALFEPDANREHPGFDMTDKSGRGCDQVADIAGWVCAVAGVEGWQEATLSEGCYEAAELLGLAHDKIGDLFLPDEIDGESIDMCPPAKAAAVLRHWADTGIVDWEVAL